MASRYSAACTVSGTSTMITSAQAQAAAGSLTVRPSACAFARDLLARMKSDAHVHAAVAQIQRVRMSLRSVAENRHLASANQREVSIGVVINLGHKNLRGAKRLSFSGFRSSAFGILVLGSRTANREPRTANREPRTANHVYTEYDTPVSVSGIAAAGPAAPPDLRLPTPRDIATRPVRTISSTPYGRSTSSSPSIFASDPAISMTID